jgi:hypothetical protein
VRGAQVALLGALAWQFPQLREVLDEHLRDNDGEILPHVVMADYERWAETALERSEPQLRDFLKVLEDAYGSGDEQLQELISVSFLEHIPRPDERGSKLREIVGPKLQEQLHVIG